MIKIKVTIVGQIKNRILKEIKIKNTEILIIMS